MSPGEGRFPPRSTPRRVDGGIRARSRTGAIGRSWWSKRFVEVMESLGGSRLTRGRSYARAGQVLSLRVSPGEVTASVQGSRPDPYAVTIGLAPFSALVWAKVEVALAEQAIHSARLLAGELPPEIEEVCAEVGAPLFPQQLRDLSLSCSCPDSAVPCKHLAATCYLLAEELDTDPFQLLHWRGRDKKSLLGRLRALRGAAPEPERSAAEAEPSAPEAERTAPAGPVVGAGLALADLTTATLAESLDRRSPDRFWLPPVPLPERPPTLATEPDLLLRQLPAPGRALGGAALLDALRPAYRRFAGSEPEASRQDR